MGDSSIRAFVLTGPEAYEVQEVPAPVAADGDAVVTVERVGICGTDQEFFTGEMPYLLEGHSHYPMRLGHEWMGTVTRVGPGVDPRWVGSRVTGDTMLGDGTCRRCRRGNQHVCERRGELGIRDGHPGALAEELTVPASSLLRLPDEVDAALGALVEPAGNALRSAWAAAAGEGDRVLVIGPGTIGLMTAMFLRADGVEVHLMGRSEAGMTFARQLGFESVWSGSDLPDLPFDAVVDATNTARVPALALDLVEPSGRVVYVGLAGQPSLIDTRTLALKDVTAVGILSASPALGATIEAFARGDVDPRPLVAATVGLEGVGPVLGGSVPGGAGPGPKIHVDPSRSP